MPRTILGLGTGPGTLLLAALAEWPGASGLGVDASEAATGYARANAQALGMTDRAGFRPGAWGKGIEAPFDLILSHQPYIPPGTASLPSVPTHEPAAAIFSGAVGRPPPR